MACGRYLARGRANVKRCPPRADLLIVSDERLERRIAPEFADALTGLPNRRAWDETLADAIADARTGQTSLSVALVQLDHFKTYGIAYGHQAGERLLKAAASSWRSVLRRGDTLARYGGEEFAVALPDCSLEEAREVLERLRTMTPDGQTCSIGVAEWDRAESAAALVERADIALYHAKEYGRDMLVAAEPSLDETA